MLSTRRMANARVATDGAGGVFRNASVAGVVSIELQLVGILRALAEVAGMFLLAQGALFLLAGRARDKNFVYQLFRIVTRPVLSSTRFVLPKAIADAAVPFVAFFVLFVFWILMAYIRQLICAQNDLACG